MVAFGSEQQNGLQQPLRRTLVHFYLRRQQATERFGNEKYAPRKEWIEWEASALHENLRVQGSDTTMWTKG